MQRRALHICPEDEHQRERKIRIEDGCWCGLLGAPGATFAMPASARGVVARDGPGHARAPPGDRVPPAPESFRSFRRNPVEIGVSWTTRGGKAIASSIILRGADCANCELPLIANTPSQPLTRRFWAPSEIACPWIYLWMLLSGVPNSVSSNYRHTACRPVIAAVGGVEPQYPVQPVFRQLASWRHCPGHSPNVNVQNTVGYKQHSLIKNCRRQRPWRR